MSDLLLSLGPAAFAETEQAVRGSFTGTCVDKRVRQWRRLSRLRTELASRLVNVLATRHGKVPDPDFIKRFKVASALV
jgi:hypothetical protein